MLIYLILQIHLHLSANANVISKWLSHQDHKHGRASQRRTCLLQGRASLCQGFYDPSEKAVVFEVRSNAKRIRRTTKHDIQIHDSLALRIDYTEQEYHLRYRASEASSADWKCLASVDILELTDPDFVGPIIGIFAVGVEAAELLFNDLEMD